MTENKMKNQLNVYHPKIKINPVGYQKLDLNWCLGIFVNGWMRIIGIEPNIPEKKYWWRWFAWFIQRWTCFFLSVGINILTIFAFYQVIRDETDEQNSSTLLWNQWMDYITASFHSISTHLCLLIFVTKNWNGLMIVMNQVEYLTINCPRAYPQVRKIVPLAVVAVIFTVIKNAFLSFNYKIFSFSFFL